MSQPDLSDVFPDMRAITGAPGLHTINGIGTVLYGARDRHAETRTYVATRFFAVLFIPIVAIDAYRVAKAEQGWYFLGKVPLGAIAKAWNLLMVAIVATVIGGALWDAHTSSPEYIAGKDLQRAERSLAAGELVTAVPLLVQVARGGTVHSAAARSDLTSILTALPSMPKPDVAIKLLVGHAPDLIDVPTLQQAALAAVAAAAAHEPAVAVSVLDALPATYQPTDSAARREALVVVLHQREPENPRWASELALIAEKAGDLVQCETLLAPVSAQLGATEGARILGSIRANQGRHDEAYTLLSAYCRERLTNLRQAELAYEQTSKAINDEAFEALNRGAASEEWYQRYKLEDETAQNRMVSEWIMAHNQGNQRMTAVENALRTQAVIVPVALDLGIVTLQRAQGLDAEARTKEMKAAEDVFLSIRGLAGDTDEFHLFYGQVCWWLGRTEDGRKELEALLTKHERKPDMLLMVSNTLRSLGANGEARTLAEEAYASAKEDEQRHDAAMQRSLCQTDPEDQVLWLSRCDTSNLSVVAHLAHARGDVAMGKGDRTTAATEYRASLEAYKKLPNNAVVLNNGALSAYSLFECTGDRAAFTEATGMMEAAVALQPSNTILQFNLCQRLYSGGIMAIMESRLDQVALGMPGEDDLLSYCYANEAQRAAVSAEFSTNNEVKRASSYLDRLQVMFPRNAEVWRLAKGIHMTNRDVAALTALRDRLRTADLDHSTVKKSYDDYASGARDEQMKVQSQATVARLATCLSATGLTGVVAMTETVDTQLILLTLGVSQPMDALVSLAEATFAAAPSSSTRRTLVGTLLCRVAEQRMAIDEEFNKACHTYSRSLSRSFLVLLALSTDHALRTNPDIQRVAQLVGEGVELMPSEASIWTWAVLDATGDARAAALGERLKVDPFELLSRDISTVLSPYAATEAVYVYWTARLHGAANPAASTKPWRDRGVLLPPLD